MTPLADALVEHGGPGRKSEGMQRMPGLVPHDLPAYRTFGPVDEVIIRSCSGSLRSAVNNVVGRATASQPLSLPG